MLQENERKYLSLLAEEHTSAKSASAEIIDLSSRLYLPKGTEHFLSDLHGEFEAFTHIRRSASGVIRRKIDLLFKDELSEVERSLLAAVVYYPEEKLKMLEEHDSWYENNIPRLLLVLSAVSAKYPREKVISALEVAGEYSRTIYELLFVGVGFGREAQVPLCVKTIIRIKEAEEFVISLSAAIRRLSVDRVHIVGDIFDRGPRPDKILDELMSGGDVDIQWGNHDALWMGAAAGSAVCIMNALLNSLTYRNLDFIEVGYGISLRPLARFAREVYFGSDLRAYYPKGDFGGEVILRDNDELIAAMRKAVFVMAQKLEGQTILKNPDFQMNDRLLLERIKDGQVLIDGEYYPLADGDFPTVKADSPYSLTPEEQDVCDYLTCAFVNSERLHRHAEFLYSNGGTYKIYNRNLLFHGAIPMTEDGEFLPLDATEGKRGRELMDYCAKVARDAFFNKTPRALDFMWFLWCGKNSPLAGRERITTFERLLVKEKTTHTEPKNAYYKVWESPELAKKILAEFDLGGSRSHIINGHIPVEKGENPIKAGGKLILIDGGFCHAFLRKTGIAGYTLIYNSEGMRISAHEPFAGKEAAIESHADIAYDTVVFEEAKDRIKILETDEGTKLIDKITDLMLLREGFKSGEIT